MGRFSIKIKNYPCPIEIRRQPVCAFVRGMPVAENLRPDLTGGRIFPVFDGAGLRFLRQIEKLEAGQLRAHALVAGNDVVKKVREALQPSFDIELPILGLGLRNFVTPPSIDFSSLFDFQLKTIR